LQGNGIIIVKTLQKRRAMKARKKGAGQSQFLMTGLQEMLNPRNPMYRLANVIPWNKFEDEFGSFYSEEGRPAKRIRLMVSLLMLKQMFDFGDETVVEHWVQNPYWQYFSGEEEFQWRLPVEPSDLVHFRKRIGKKGIEKIFQMSIDLHGKKAKEKEILVDTTVQEKNITYPTDAKLCCKIVARCLKIAKKESIVLRQSYRRTVKKLLLLQRWNRHPKNYKKALKAQRKLKTIAGRLIRELYRKLSKEGLEKYRTDLELFEQILNQKRMDKNKLYSLHEPHVYCMSKGKAHKKYEYGVKSSIAVTKNTGIIVGAMSFERNIYDGHTLPQVIEQTEKLTGKRPEAVIVDRGYKGKKYFGETEILSPNRPKKDVSYSEKRRARKRFRKRAGIEPRIGHLKSDFRLTRNYLKGFIGDQINVLLAAAAFNLKKWLRDAASFVFFILQNLYAILGQKCFISEITI